MRARLLSQLAKSQSAAVAPTVALSLFGLIAVGGIAFDYARMATLDTELQQAADQAALSAATQLDGKDDARARATSAANSLIVNQTNFANESTSYPGRNIGIPTVIFYSVYDSDDPTKNELATTDAEAHFVQVTTAQREARFALTPIVNALSSGNLTGTAVAGLHSGVCKVPPLMICNPNPGTSFASGRTGFGVQVVAHKNGAWSPGNFGYLDVGLDNNGAPDQLGAMAYQDPVLKCYDVSTNNVYTGNTEPLIDAANTRFDIYNVPNGTGSTLGNCSSGVCPAATNVTKDLVRSSTATGGIGSNDCKAGNKGWELPTNQFSPGKKGKVNETTQPIDDDGKIDAMGLPRDNCHYTSYNNKGCYDTNSRIGDGKWARLDYFAKYHSGNLPPDSDTITRYQTYRWEINNSNMPKNASAGGSMRQQGTPVCSSGVLDASRDRRVFSVAIVDNCASLNGASVKATISQWVDMFFVEPGYARGNGADDKQIYLEIIGESKATGNDSVGAQVVRRDMPYLIE